MHRRPIVPWFDIEIAPRDGTLVLVAWRISMRVADHGPVLASWRTYHPNAAGKPCWRGVDGAKIGTPTHWTPVPWLPGEAEGEKAPCDWAIGGRSCVLELGHKARHKDKDGAVWDRKAWAWVTRRSKAG